MAESDGQKSSILSQNSLIPLSFALLLITFMTYGERRLSQIEANVKLLELRIEREEDRVIVPANEIELKLDAVNQRLGRIEAKLDIMER